MIEHIANNADIFRNALYQDPMTIRALLSSLPLRVVLLILTLIAASATAILARFGLGPVDPLQIVDGTYQTFGMLDRIARGELPGIAYIPYLGIGLSYALTPIFLALGSSVYAAFAVAELMTRSIWFLICWALCWAAGFRRSESLTLGSLLFLAMAIVSLWIPSATPGYLAGFSLLLLRESAVLVPLAACIVIADNDRRYRTMAAAAGVMLFWSPSAGVAQFIATLIIIVIATVRKSRFGQAYRDCLTLIAISGGTAFLTAALISNGHPLDLLRRVFVDAGNAQFWFFEGFQDTDRILVLADMSRAIARRASAAVYGVIGATGFFLTIRHFGLACRRGQAAALAGFAWLISGLASQIAGHVAAHYMLPFYAGGSLLLCARLLSDFADRRILNFSLNVSAISTGVVAATVTASLYLLPMLTPINRLENRYIGALGLPLPAAARTELGFLTSLRHEFDEAVTPANRRIFSTYYAWPDILLGATPRPQFNSLIHVLSEANRTAYLDDFRHMSPPWVATLDPAYNKFAYWSTRASWFFYRDLLRNYTPAFRGTASTYWRRLPVPAASVRIPIACLIRRKTSTTTILYFAASRAHRELLLDVALDYEADPGSPTFGGDLGRGYLRVADQSSGLLARLRRTQSPHRDIPAGLDARPGILYGLPSGTRIARLPVEHYPARASTLRLDLQGSSNAFLVVKRCRIVNAFINPMVQLDHLPVMNRSLFQ